MSAQLGTYVVPEFIRCNNSSIVTANSSVSGASACVAAPHLFREQMEKKGNIHMGNEENVAAGRMGDGRAAWPPSGQMPTLSGMLRDNFGFPGSNDNCSLGAEGVEVESNDVSIHLMSSSLTPVFC